MYLTTSTYYLVVESGEQTYYKPLEKSEFRHIDVRGTEELLPATQDMLAEHTGDAGMFYWASIIVAGLMNAYSVAKKFLGKQLHIFKDIIKSITSSL